MLNSYAALQRVKQGIEGSLQNPNIDPTIRNFLQGEPNLVYIRDLLGHSEEIPQAMPVVFHFIYNSFYHG